MADKKTYEDDQIEFNLEDTDYEMFDELEDNRDGCCTDGCSETVDEDGKTHYTWSMIAAFDRVLHYSRDHKCKLGGGQKSRSAMDFLMKTLGMTEMQIMVIAMLIDEGRPMSWNNIAHFLGISRLRAMTYTAQIENLVDERRWLIHAAAQERGCRYEGFALVHGVIRAIRHNEIFQPECIDGLDTQMFVDRIADCAGACTRDDDISYDDEYRSLMVLVNHNPQLPLCKVILNMKCATYEKCLLLYFVADYAHCGETPPEGLSLRDISLFYETTKFLQIRKTLKSGNHVLMKEGWIEYKCNDGMADKTHFVLTQKAKYELLDGFKLSFDFDILQEKVTDRDLISHNSIETKQLYYNAPEQKIVNRLRSMLTQEQFPQIQQRLKEEGMRTGVAVLLNGGPGTGKTELVRQLSRETGRDLLMIDMSQIKDKYVGESETRTKAIFERYSRLCKNKDIKPILFLNECDAILGKRIENVEHSVDKMLNTMQNILLQCIEDFDGILVCTTNLAEKALDNAFMRRFLIKAEFTKPNATVRAHIWQSMMPRLKDSDAQYLAEHYDFSGGQIENAKRKATIEHVVSGTDATLAALCEYCDEENVIAKNSSRRRVAGFYHSSSTQQTA